MLEPDVRQQDDRRVEDVRRVEPAAEASFDRGDVDARGRRTRPAPPPSAPRTASPDAARLPSARARTRARSPPRRCRAAPPNPRRGARCSADRSPSVSQQRGDRPRRGRLAVRADDVDRRETRAPGWPSSASSACMRSRPNSSGHGESDAIQAGVAAPSSGMLTTAACTRTVGRSSSEGGGRMLELAIPTFTRAAAGLDASSSGSAAHLRHKEHA